MKDLYKRFNITVNLDGAISIFRNKIENILSHGQLGEEIFETKDNEIDVFWELCNVLGIEYQYHGYSGGKVSHIFDDLNFPEYLFRLQILLNFLLDCGKKQSAINLIGIIENAINASPTDLGIRIKFYKTKGAQILFSGAKLLDSKLVDDILGVLEDKEKLPIKVAFEKGLREFSEGKKAPEKLRDCVRDMQLATDELMHFVFKDKNIGLKHLFKDKRCEKLGLNQYQVQIFWQYKEFADKLAKHKSDAKIDEFDAESFIYLTGLLMRLILLKKDYD